MKDAEVIDLAELRHDRETARAEALLVLFSGVLGKPLVRRELTPIQRQERDARVARRREQRRNRIATATGTDS